MNSTCGSLLHIIEAVQYNTVRYSTVQYGTVRYSTVRYSTVRYSTVRYSTVQYSTVQYSTVQYSTVQYSTIYGHRLTHILTHAPPIFAKPARLKNCPTAATIPWLRSASKVTFEGLCTEDDIPSCVTLCFPLSTCHRKPDTLGLAMASIHGPK